MEGLLQGIPSSRVFVDKNLNTGPTTEKHLGNVKNVLRRLTKVGLQLKAGKCKFMKSGLHHKGSHPVKAKAKAVKVAPIPTNSSKLKSFLGMLNFYGKFMPNLSSTLEPLHVLLRKDIC